MRPSARSTKAAASLGQDDEALEGLGQAPEAMHKEPDLQVAQLVWPGKMVTDEKAAAQSQDANGDRSVSLWGKDDGSSSEPKTSVFNSFYALAAGGLALGAGIGRSGGNSGSAADVPVPVPQQFRIRVQDGPVKGATVFIDANKNGKFDQGEVKVGETNENGDVVLNAALPAGTVLTAVGGTNAPAVGEQVGLPNTMVMTAVLGKDSGALTVINPLTSLVAALHTGQNYTVAQAEAAVKTAFGIDQSTDLIATDPLGAGGTAATPTGRAILTASAQLATLASDKALVDASKGVMAVMAEHVAGHSGAKLDLADPATLKVMFSAKEGDAIAAVVSQLAVDNKVIADAAAGGGDIAGAQLAAAAPVIQGLVQDTGSSATDKYTAVAALTVTGQNVASKVELSYDQGKTWVSQAQFAPPDGQLSVLARLRYESGLTTKASEPFSFTLDSKQPASPGLSLSNDTGVSATDGISSNPGIVVTGAQSAAKLEYSLDGQASWKPWTAGFAPGKLTDGAYTLYVRQSVEKSGATSASAKLGFTLDTKAEPGVAGLASTSANDTGISQTDGITSNSSPLLVGQTEAGATQVTITVNGKSYSADSIAANGMWQFQLPTTLPDGTYAPAVKVVDAAGNVSASTTMAAFVIDHTAPTAGTAALSYASDSGAGSDDGITNVARPILTGQAEAGATVRVAVGDGVYTTTADAKGDWQVQVTQSLEDGDYTPTVIVTDRAGNASLETDGTAFTVDAGAPVDDSPGGLVQSEEIDTGVSQEDGITSHTLPQLTGNVGEPDIVVVVKLDGRTYSTVSNDDGDWFIQVPEGRELIDGTYIPTYTYLDAAGNQVRVNGPAITIDTEAPTEATAELLHDAENDTGASSEDGITNNASPVIAGTTEANAHVLVDIDGNVFETDADENGDWQVTADGLADGVYIPLITVTDLAGNVGEPIEGVPFEVDTVGPDEATGDMVHDDTNDTGVLPDDGLTANAQPTFEGTAEAGATVHLILGDQEFETVADEDGNWSLTPDSALDDGEYTPEITVYDLAGNATTTEAPVITIDTTAPTADTVTGSLLADSDNDTGVSSEDGITGNNAPTLAGTADALALISVDINGDTYETQADEDGNWTLSLSDLGVTLDDGEYTPIITVIDAAGNASEGIEGQAFTIDTEAPTEATAELLHDAENDTGASSEDGITNNASPVIAGTTEANAHVLVDIDGNVFETDADENGDWQVTADGLADGVYTPFITVTDLAGNVGEPIEAPPITIDTVIGSASGGLAHDEDNDTGPSADDGVTSVNTPLLRGEAEAGALVSFRLNGVSYETTATEDGTWEVQIDDALPNGKYALTLTVTDAAGNFVEQSAESFTIIHIEGSDVPRIAGHQVFNYGITIDVNPFAGTGAAAGSTVEDHSGTLPEGLSIDPDTQHIVGTPLAAGYTWISLNSSDLAGNISTTYFQLAVTRGTQAASNIFNADPAMASMYLGTDAAQTTAVYSSHGDVIMTRGGNDTINLFNSQATISEPLPATHFARLDGGSGDDRVNFSGTNLAIDFSVFNNPDSADGQVLQHFESFYFANTKSEITVTAADLFHLQSDVLDAVSGANMVRFMANSTNGGSVTMEDLTLAALPFTDAAGMAKFGIYQFGSNGLASNGAADQRYAKYMGTFVDNDGNHLVELLLQRGLSAA